MRAVPGYLLATDVLRTLAPDELDDLPLVWEDYLRNPIEPGDLKADDRLLGSGLATAFAEWAPLVVTFIGSQVLGGAVVDAAKDRLRAEAGRVGRRAWALAHRRRGGASIDLAAAQSLTIEELRVVQAEAEKAAVASGRSKEEAKVFGDAVAGALIRGHE